MKINSDINREFTRFYFIFDVMLNCKNLKIDILTKLMRKNQFWYILRMMMTI